MTKDVTGQSERRAYWPVGIRVNRKSDGEKHGTVVEQDGVIKVKWDAGKTSYYRHSDLANVELPKN